MKTHTGMLVSHLSKDGNKIYTSYLDGTFHGGYTTMWLSSLHKGVEGKDLVYDVALKELVNYKQDLKDGKDVAIHVEWDIKDDYSEYIACRILKVVIKNLDEI